MQTHTNMYRGGDDMYSDCVAPNKRGQTRHEESRSQRS